MCYCSCYTQPASQVHSQHSSTYRWKCGTSSITKVNSLHSHSQHQPLSPHNVDSAFFSCFPSWECLSLGTASALAVLWSSHQRHHSHRPSWSLSASSIASRLLSLILAPSSSPSSQRLVVAAKSYSLNSVIKRFHQHHLHLLRSSGVSWSSDCEWERQLRRLLPWELLGCSLLATAGCSALNLKEIHYPSLDHRVESWHCFQGFPSV